MNLSSFSCKNTFSPFRANLLNHTKPLTISSYLTKEEDYVPMLSAMRKFSKILEILPSTRPAYKYVQVIRSARYKVCLYFLGQRHAAP